MQINSQSKIKLNNVKIFINLEQKKQRENAVNDKIQHKKIMKIKENRKSWYNIPIIFNDYELNFLTYKEALKFDKRKLNQFYISLIKAKHPLIFSFVPVKDYNLMIIKLCLFCLSFSIFYVVNSLFFDESTIHDIYENNGVYNFIYFLPEILCSFFISYIISILIKYFFLSERNIIIIKKEQNVNIAKKLVSKIKRDIIIKYIIFFATGNILLLIFWYYLSSFGAVYQNTQIILIKNTLFSFLLSLIYPFIISIVPAILRKIALSDRKKKKEFIFRISLFLQYI